MTTQWPATGRRRIGLAAPMAEFASGRRGTRRAASPANPRALLASLTAMRWAVQSFSASLTRAASFDFETDLVKTNAPYSFLPLSPVIP